MADRPTNRPRRAFGADDPTTKPGTDARTTPAEPGGVPAAEGPATGSSAAGGGLSGRFTEDEARPIFREAASDADAATVRTPASETGTPAGGGTGSAAPGATDPAGVTEASEGDAAGAAPTRPSRFNFTPRTPTAEDDATTVLPRTTGRAEDGAPLAAEDDDLEDRPRRLGRRGRLALLVAGVAAVVAIGLAIGSAVVGEQGTPGAGGDPTSSSTVASATPSTAALLDDESMLTALGAQPIDARRTWTPGETVRGALPEGSGPSCLGSNPLEGAPTAQQTLSRTLTASGTAAPTALHVAQSYASVEDATQAYAVTSRALGTCAMTGDWLFRGRVVDGVGDESTAVAVHSVAGGDRTQHWVVVSRTGRALDVVDAATPGKTALDPNSVTQALASAVGVQCGPAGGTCPATVATKDGPPPVGGDEPGFLTTGDLPPAGSTTAPWVGTPVETPSVDFSGSQCESVTWATTAATAKSSRVYLLQDVSGIFGLNEIVLTARDATAASKLVDKIRSDWTSCKERKLTATVDSPTKVAGIAADGTAVTGWTTEVQQKAGSTTTRFRVGIASSGDKVAFVFLNPQKGLDVDGTDWNTVAVRAVQRATQQG